jgi:hypothetical protein
MIAVGMMQILFRLLPREDELSGTVEFSGIYHFTAAGQTSGAISRAPSLTSAPLPEISAEKLPPLIAPGVH